MDESANLVRPPHSWRNSTSTPSAPPTSRAASATARTSSWPMGPGTSAHSYLHVSEPGRGGAVAHPGHLPGLPLPAVRGAPQPPGLRPADGVAGTPELRGDAGVVRIPVHLLEPAVADPPGDLAPELEVDPLVVDRPRLVGRKEQPLPGVPDDLLQGPLPR